MRTLLIILLIAMVSLTSGCYSLRKKFIRKKKYEEEPAYVTFKEYPTKPTREVYVDYYLFIRGWLEELEDSLQRGLGYTRQKRAINETVMNFEQIMIFFDSPEAKEKINPLYEELLKIQTEVEQGASMSDMKRNSLLRDVEKFKRRFEKDFNYTDAEQWMG
jgi:hypothetical protein